MSVPTPPSPAPSEGPATHATPPVAPPTAPPAVPTAAPAPAPPASRPAPDRALTAVIAALLVVIVLGAATLRSPGGSPPGPLTPAEVAAYARKQARITTRYGDMVVRFFPDVAPRTVKNFCGLVEKGFYDGVVFHRVIRGFMIQGGDPTGTGGGGPGYTIPDELNARTHKRGVLSMAHSSAPNSAGSQFFIVHGESAPHLDGGYTVFGELSSGFDVLDRIATAPVSGDRPLEPVRMERVQLEDRKD